MHSCMDVQVINLHGCTHIQVTLPVFDLLQVNVRQTCTYIEEYAYMYAYTLKYG
jgi:hypothetical protein